VAFAITQVSAVARTRGIGALPWPVPYASMPYENRRSEGTVVARFVVEVMLKPEILDSQGQAVARALPRLGFEGVTGVRQGKRFEIEVEGPADEAATERVRKMAETLLANPVIETFELRAE
jgi:phosphoribosylformylglycinamidine synthase subunit PurS